MSQLIEDILPPIQSAGLNTNKDVQFGGVVVGNKANVINASTTAVLTVAQSGSTVLFNAAAGFMVTLPAPVSGLNYNFVVATTPTSASHGIITNSSSVFLLGQVLGVTNATGTVATFSGNGSTHIALRMNGTTTGGSLGTYINATAISTTQWLITGANYGSGTIVTPFNTV